MDGFWRASDKVLQNKAFNIAEHPKYDGYKKELGSIAYKLFDENSVDTNRYMHATQLVVLLKMKLCQINN